MALLETPQPASARLLPLRLLAGILRRPRPPLLFKVSCRLASSCPAPSAPPAPAPAEAPGAAAVLLAHPLGHFARIAPPPAVPPRGGRSAATSRPDAAPSSAPGAPAAVAAARPAGPSAETPAALSSAAAPAARPPSAPPPRSPPRPSYALPGVRPLARPRPRDLHAPLQQQLAPMKRDDPPRDDLPVASLEREWRDARRIESRLVRLTGETGQKLDVVEKEFKTGSRKREIFHLAALDARFRALGSRHCGIRPSSGGRHGPASRSCRSCPRNSPRDPQSPRRSVPQSGGSPCRR